MLSRRGKERRGEEGQGEEFGDLVLTALHYTRAGPMRRSGLSKLLLHSGTMMVNA